MGKRRIRCLYKLGVPANHIIGFDCREDRRLEAEDKYGISTFDSFEASVAEKPDVHIISLPPDLHVEYARLSIKHGMHFFTEASVVNDGVAEMMADLQGTNLIAAPSCTLRFFPLVKRIKQLVDDGAIGKILSFTFHCGEYLPDWHPYEAIQDFYVSKRETGGCREIVPFELVWLVWIFGDIDSIVAFKGKQSTLDVDIDDVYQVIMQFEEGQLGHVLIDVVARSLVRNGRMISEEGIIEWDYVTNVVRVYHVDTCAWTEYDESYDDIEDFYADEIKAVIDAVEGKAPYPYTFDEDHKLLNWLVDAETNGAKIQYGNP